MSSAEDESVPIALWVSIRDAAKLTVALYGSIEVVVLPNWAEGTLRMPTVLIAEDDLNVANALAEVVVNAGYRLCGIARSVEEAIDLGLSKRPQVAVLDLWLANRRPAVDAAAHLNPLNTIGILYTTGNISRFALTAVHGHACLAKPYSSKTLLRSLDIVLGLVATGTVLRPLPPGFRLLRQAPILSAEGVFR